MTALVIAEHDNASIKGATLNTVTAAAACGGDVHVLVAGHNAGGAAQAAAQIGDQRWMRAILDHVGVGRVSLPHDSCATTREVTNLPRQVLVA